MSLSLSGTRQRPLVFLLHPPPRLSLARVPAHRLHHEQVVLSGVQQEGVIKRVNSTTRFIFSSSQAPFQYITFLLLPASPLSPTLLTISGGSLTFTSISIHPEANSSPFTLASPLLSSFSPSLYLSLSLSSLTFTGNGTWLNTEVSTPQHISILENSTFTLCPAQCGSVLYIDLAVSEPPTLSFSSPRFISCTATNTNQREGALFVNAPSLETFAGAQWLTELIPRYDSSLLLSFWVSVRNETTNFVFSLLHASFAEEEVTAEEREGESGSECVVSVAGTDTQGRRSAKLRSAIYCE